MDLNEICETLDRKRSNELFNALRDTDDEEQRSEIANVLGWLNDPRLVAPLGQLMTDVREPEALRLAASEVLRDMTNSPDPDHGDLEFLWNSGDPVLQRHALGFMTWRHETMLTEILDDPQHPLFLALLSELRLAFPFPRFAGVLVQALGDKRADIRFQAAESLSWNKPVLALEPLIEALDDPDLEVQQQVIETLQYYPSYNVRSALRKYVKHEQLGTFARKALAYNKQFFAKDKGREDERTDLPDDQVPGDASTGRPDWLRSANAFKKRFGSLDACWSPLVQELGEIDWNHVSRFARSEIADFLISCSDVLVRQYAPFALAVWGDARVCDLLEDRYFVVAKAAGFAVRKCKPTPDLVEQIWILLKSASGVHAAELLESLIVLSGAKGWQARCKSIALDAYWEEGVREVAINALFDDFSENGNSADILAEIADSVLGGEPVSSWALHCTILRRSAERNKIKLPGLKHLEEVDHRPLEIAIAGTVA